MSRFTGEYIAPKERKALHNRVREEAGNRCIRCGHPSGDTFASHAPERCDTLCTHPADGKLRILTVHHLTGKKDDNRWWNLLALCQSCHLTIQGRVIPERPWLFAHTPWFVPYVCGFYASYYGGQDITRAEADATPERWLALNPALSSESPRAVSPPPDLSKVVKRLRRGRGRCGRASATSPTPRKPRKWLPRATKAIQRAWLKRGTKAIPQVNVKRQARRAKAYAAHLRSAYWLTLRRYAWERDRGFCQCPDCIAFRKNGGDYDETCTDAWFDVRHKPHGFDTHHTTYARFGHELLSDVLTMIPAHHRKLEALTGKRAKFLRGSK